jgi:hypothetical protein
MAEEITFGHGARIRRMVLTGGQPIVRGEWIVGPESQCESGCRLGILLYPGPQWLLLLAGETRFTQQLNMFLLIDHRPILLYPAVRLPMLQGVYDETMKLPALI